MFLQKYTQLQIIHAASTLANDQSYDCGFNHQYGTFKLNYYIFFHRIHKVKMSARRCRLYVPQTNQSVLRFAE